MIILAYCAFSGMRRGFLAGAADLIGMVIAFLFAVKGYGAVSSWLSPIAGLPHILLNFLTLTGLFLLGEVLFRLFVGPLLRFAYRYLLLGPLESLDGIAGLLPGLARGLLVAAALVAFIDLFPLSPGLHEEVQSSALGGRLSDAVSAAAPRLEALFGGSPHDTALFIAPPSEEAPRRMSFPPGVALHEDVAAEQTMLGLLNEERATAGLKPLLLDQRLRAVALVHSEDMFRQGYFAHESPDGDTPGDRLRKARIPFLAMGENLAYAPNVAVAHAGLMNSPGHRSNMLSPLFGRVGIGVVDGGLYGKMFSQEFTN